MHSSTKLFLSALGHLIMPRSMIPHSHSLSRMPCRCYTQCGAIEASQVRLHPAESHGTTHATTCRQRVCSMTKNKYMGRHESSTAACAAQRVAIGVCTVQMQRQMCGRQCALHRSSTGASLRARRRPAVEVTINAERHLLCSEQRTQHMHV
jgi:hypothetical protein